MDSRTTREVSRVSLLGGHGEDLTARLERGAHACGRQRGCMDQGSDGPHLRARPRHVTPHVHDELLCLPVRDIVHMDEARLFEHDRACPGRRVHDIEVREVRELPEHLRISAICVKIGDFLAVGNEIDRVADPHRVVVVAIGPRQFLDGVVSETNHRDRVGPTAAVATPHAFLVPARNELLRHFFVREASTVRRVHARPGTRQGEQLWEPAIN